MRKRIFTEEPEQELWRNLLQFSYKSNIKRYFTDNNITIINDPLSEDNFDALSNAIAGAIMQADEYFKASKTASLHIEPLMLYYGASNLLYAMSLLTSGKKIEIRNHGMRIEVDRDLEYMADIKVKFFRTTDGGVHIFAKSLGFDKDLCQYSQIGPDDKECWTLSDYLDSIAEISDDYNKCYSQRESKILMLEVVKTVDGIVEKIRINNEEKEFSTADIEGFSYAYLKPSVGTSREGERHIVLHRKLNGVEIEEISYSGQPYLRIAHNADGKLITLPEELNLFVSLFVLGNMCRYYPDKWYPFVTQDSTGEKLLIEKLLYYSRRILPNIVLNRIVDDNVIFVSDKYEEDDRVRLVSDHDVKEMVQKEVSAQIRRQQVSNTVNLRKR